MNLIKTNTPYFAASFLLYLIKHSPVWLLPLYLSNLINTLLDGGSLFSKGLVYSTIGMVILVVANVPFHSLHIKIFSIASRRIENSLRKQLIRKLQELSLGFYQKTKTGQLTAKFLRDVETIENALNQTVLNLLPAITSFVYVIAVTLARQPLVTLFFLSALPMLALVRLFYSKQMNRTNSTYRKDMENLSAKVNESIDMLPVARAHALEDTEIRQIEIYFDKINVSGLALDVINAVFGSSTWAILQLCSLTALLFSAWLATKGKIPMGDIVLYQSFFTMMSNAMGSVFNVMPIIFKGQESYRSIMEVLNAPDLEFNKGKAPFPSVKGQFHLKDLDFRYGESPDPVLKIKDLTIPAGQSVGLIGPSGSGKTTFLNLLIGFLRPDGGTISLDGFNYSDHDVRTLRRRCSFVSQTPILFSGTIRENIAYGDDSIDDGKVMEALEAANAVEFVSKFPEGVHSMIGERGVNLSGGQRQRLVLARAFYRDPAILFFDEATSALDNEAEEKVQSAMDRLMKGRTTFIIAHRLTTLKNVDRILVLDGGQIVEDGPAAEILESKSMSN